MFMPQIYRTPKEFVKKQRLFFATCIFAMLIGNLESTVSDKILKKIADH